CHSIRLCQREQDGILIFFFQAVGGIRDFHVTGVLTCALPVYVEQWAGDLETGIAGTGLMNSAGCEDIPGRHLSDIFVADEAFDRSDERREGIAVRDRSSADAQKCKATERQV